MHLIGTFVLHCLKHRILFHARYVLSKINQIISSQPHLHFLKLFVTLDIDKVVFQLMVVFDRLKNKNNDIAMIFKTINIHRGDFVCVLLYYSSLKNLQPWWWEGVEQSSHPGSPPSSSATMMVNNCYAFTHFCASVSSFLK